MDWTDPQTLVWTTDGSPLHDRVRGDLAVLRGAGGDFTPSVLECRDDLTGNASDEPGPPGAGGDYYLVRGDSECWAGSYDSGEASQSGTRDDGIAASPNACP